MTRLTLLALLMLSGCVSEPRPLAYGVSAAANTVCATGATVDGIDVSNYDGAIDWMKVAGAGKKFAIAKATEGTGFHDSTFAANWSGMKAAGVIRGAYHFFHSNEDPVAQANYFLAAVGTLGPGDLPPMLDLEVADGQSAATVASTALTWLQTVESMTGKKPIVYTYPSFWSSVGASASFAGYPLNIANYGVNCPDVVGSWSSWTMWQYSDTGTVAGINAQIDEDHFNGDLAALQKLANGASGPPVPSDPCAGLVDGSYCGGDGITGDKSTLFVCKGHAVSAKTVCAHGCKSNPPGIPDACNPAAFDGGVPAGDGGGDNGNGNGGGDDGGANGNGGPNGNGGQGGSAGHPGEPTPIRAAQGGCAVAATNPNELPPALLLALLAIGLRRRGPTS